jgi:hypothetical protein
MRVSGSVRWTRGWFASDGTVDVIETLKGFMFIGGLYHQYRVTSEKADWLDTRLRALFDELPVPGLPMKFAKIKLATLMRAFFEELDVPVEYDYDEESLSFH